MQHSRLLRYIEQLDTRERERFRQFVQSPYFNQHDKTTRLLDYILKQLGSRRPKLEREQVYKVVFKSEELEDQKLFDLASNLMKLYHRFLAYEQLEQDRFAEPLATLSAAFKRSQFDLLKNRANLLNKQLHQSPQRDGEYQYTSYQIQRLLTYYGSEFVDRSKSETPQRMLQHLDRFYLIEKLRHCCHLTANMQELNTSYEFALLEPVLAFVKNNWEQFKEEISVQMYYTILMSLQHPEDESFYLNKRDILRNHLGELSTREGRDLFTFTQNYCIRQINNGQSRYQAELFNTYKRGLESGLLLNNDILSEWDYKNIISLGCTLKEYTWTEQFIEDYKDHLMMGHRENAYRYNLAYFYYHKKMYDEVLSALLHVQFTDVNYHLSTSTLLLRTYYAQDDTEALLSLIETFRIYVMRNRKMTTNKKQGYTNFLRFAKRLVTLKHGRVAYSRKELRANLEKLHQKIEAAPNVMNRYWLLEEIAQPATVGA